MLGKGLTMAASLLMALRATWECSWCLLSAVCDSRVSAMTRLHMRLPTWRAKSLTQASTPRAPGPPDLALPEACRCRRLRHHRCGYRLLHPRRRRRRLSSLRPRRLAADPVSPSSPAQASPVREAVPGLWAAARSRWPPSDPCPHHHPMVTCSWALRPLIPCLQPSLQSSARLHRRPSEASPGWA